MNRDPFPGDLTVPGSLPAVAAPPAAPRLRLSAMMFLEYFVQGTWWITLGTYLGRTLGFHGVQIGLCYSAAAIAAIVSPFFVGMVADRFFATERVLAVLHLVGGVILWAAAGSTRFALLFPLLVAYFLCYMPTMPLTNAMAFHHLDDAVADFPRVRVLGPVGWIVAGVIVGQLRLEGSPLPMRIAAVASLGMAAFCLTLPHTPPPAAGTRARLRDLLGLEALGLMKDRAFAMFVVASFLVCIPIQAYSAFANLFLNEIGVRAAASKMTLAQCSEVVATLLLPWFLPRLGVRRMILIGMAAWVLRYLLFALGGPGALEPLLLAAILLHGFCYVFALLTGYIYVDQQADVRIRGAAQGFISLVTLGLGYLVGGWASGKLVDAFGHVGPTGTLTHDWHTIWLVPAGTVLAILLLFAASFRPEPAAATP